MLFSIPFFGVSFADVFTLNIICLYVDYSKFGKGI